MTEHRIGTREEWLAAREELLDREKGHTAGARVYELTDWGRELEETVMSLGRWAARTPTPPSPAPIRSADSVILALRARFDPRAAHGLRDGYELRLGEDRFRIEVADGQLEVARGEAHRAVATIDTDNDTIAAVLWGGRSLADAQRSGTMTIEGDKAAVKRFVQLFPMPEPAAAPSPA
jgi:alkyl sulfatase BDS1-like metallo-beta-lactamase superfamily hydrolase